MSAVETTPRGTQAVLLREVARAKYPKLILGSLASNHHMTLDDLQAILRHHGYPDVAKMTAAATRLAQPVAAAAANVPAQRDGSDAAFDPLAAGQLGTLTEIDIDELHPDPDNPREELRDIEDLAASLLEVGLLQPVVARRHQGQLYLVAGHRRLAAAKHNRWTTIPCIIRADMRPDHVLAAMLIENGQRSDLDAIEEARGLNRLKHQLGCTDLELGKRIGRSGAFVSNRLALLALSAEEQEQIRTGQMRLAEAQHRGRLNAGKVMAKGQKRGWHLGPEHQLAQQVKARCNRLGHKTGRTVGAMGCGACWESVIRADERVHLQEHLSRTGHCTVCGTDQEGPTTT